MDIRDETTRLHADALTLVRRAAAALRDIPDRSPDRSLDRSPDGDAVAVAVEALRGDAGQWREWADVLAAAARVAGDLGLTGAELCALSELAGLPERYGAVRQRAVELATQGSGGFTAVADALAAAADGYEADERAAVHRLRGAW